MATEGSPLLAEANVQQRSKIQASSRTLEASLNSRSLSNNVDATRLSPATPFLPPPEPTSMPPAAQPLKKPRSALWAFLFNTSALVVVCLAGVLGWYLSSRAQYTPEQSPSHRHHHHQDNRVNHDPLSSPSPFSSTSFSTLSHSASTARRTNPCISISGVKSSDTSAQSSTSAVVFHNYCSISGGNRRMVYHYYSSSLPVLET